MFRKIGVALAIVTLALMMAATQADAMMYADDVLSAIAGYQRWPDNPPEKALYAPDFFTVANVWSSFYDLGNLGTLTVSFPHSFSDMPGVNEVIVWEVGPPYEYMDIQLKIDGTNEISPVNVSQVRPAKHQGLYEYIVEFDLADLGASPGTSWNQLTIIDGGTYPKSGGADIDAVGIVPEPATMLLLGGGLLGFALLGKARRKRS